MTTDVTFVTERILGLTAHDELVGTDSFFALQKVAYVTGQAAAYFVQTSETRPSPWASQISRLNSHSQVSFPLMLLKWLTDILE